MPGIQFVLLCMCYLSFTSAHAGTEALTYEEQTLTVDGERRTARVPQGYRLEWLSRMDAPRMLTFAANGDLFAGSQSGKVYRLPAPYVKPEVLVQLDDYPHSVAFRKNEILIARTGGLYRAPYQAGQSKIAADSVVLLAALPGGGGHSSRTVGVGPDGRVYVSLGIQSNCSDQYLGAGYPFDEQRGGVMVLREGDGAAVGLTERSASLRADTASVPLGHPPAYPLRVLREGDGAAVGLTERSASLRADTASVPLGHPPAYPLRVLRVDDLVTGFQLADGSRWARPAGVAIGPDGALYFSSDSDTNGLFRLARIR